MKYGYRLLPLLIAACLPARAATVSVDPPAVEARHTATVAIAGRSEECAPIITNRQARVEGSTLLLSAAFASNPAALCLPGPYPYTADFDLPALPPGAYTVLMSILPACAYSATPCPFAAPMPDTGRLVATDAADLQYRIDPEWTPPGKPFALRLTAPAFQCGSRFSSLTAEVAGHRISLGFVHEPHPEALCPAVVGRYGPVFDLSGLEAGDYQVFAAPGIVCDRGLCAPVPGPATLAGALEVKAIPDKLLWIEPHIVKAGVRDSFALVGPGFSCNDVLLDKQTEVKDGSIRLRYAMSRTRIMCDDSLFIGRAFFALPALAPGAYPVVLQPPADCPFISPLCGKGADSSRVANPIVDTLYAEASASLKGAARKPAAVHGRTAPGSLRVPWRGGSADLAGRREPAR